MAAELEAVQAVEIVMTDNSSWLTMDYITIEEVRAAIQRNEALRVYWVRSDGTRFEEDGWFNPELIKMIRTNRS